MFRGGARRDGDQGQREMDGCPGGSAGGGLAGQQGRRVVFRLNVPAQAFHDVLANGQPQSRASPSPVFFHLMESFKNAGQIALGMPGPKSWTVTRTMPSSTLPPIRMGVPGSA